jgi:putative endopeptidase
MRSRHSVVLSRAHPAFARKWWQIPRRTIAFPAVLGMWMATSGQPLAAQAGKDFLTANIDSAVAPGEDFFQYANGLWLKSHPIPDNAARWGIWNVVSEDIDSRLRRISENAAAKKAPRGSLEQLIGDFWFTGMDSATVAKQDLAPLKPDLDRIDRIRSIRDLIDVVAIFHSRDQSIGHPWHRVLFFGHVEQDEKNSNRWIFSLLQSGISMNAPEYYSGTDPQHVRVREAFREYLFRTFVRLQRDSVKAWGSEEAVYELEARLAEANDEGYGYQKIGLTELSRLAPTIEWRRYLRRIGATVVDSVNMRSPRYYQTLDSLLRTTSLETWKDYLRFWLVKVNSGYLDTSGEYFAYDRAYTGALRQRPRWQRVLAQEKNLWLGQPLARLYVEEYFPATVKARHQAVAESIRDAFRERIEQLDWMSDATRNSALLKLARLRITIGLPETLMDYSTMPLRRDSYVLNGIRASKWFHDRDIRKLNHPVGTASRDPMPSFNSAEYDVAHNEVRFGPVVINVPGLRDEELDDAVVYGATYLAHEISHAFDSGGRHYDADGNKVDWWTAGDDAAFLERVRVLIDEYDEFMPLEGLHVNGQRSLQENMADLVGLRVALDAFRKTEQFKRNERIAGFTPLQRFFLAYAFSHMGHQRRESLTATLNGAYAPDRERVNGVVTNIPEFYEAFDVKPGDRMYRAEDARVKIW